MEKKVSVITGAAGHVGYALLKELLNHGENVRLLLRKDVPIFYGLDCVKVYGDVTDLESLKKAFEGADVVYHLAGIVDIDGSQEDIIWNVNVGGTKNVVAACKVCGVKRLVYASSVDAIPPLPDDEVMTEINHFEPKLLDGTYAKTKAAATQYVLDNHEGLEAVVCHPGACIGPYDFKISSIGEMVRMFMEGRFPVSLSFGMYDFVDVRDVGRGMYNASTMGRDGECYILTCDHVTVDEMMQILAEKLGTKPPSVRLPLWAAKAAAPLAEVYYRVADQKPLFTRYSIRKLTQNGHFSYAKAERELDYHPRSAKESLNDMVDWILENEVYG
ncbi:MAG: NAD-dependent epimerase/dehydratase family protein [Oscillospiraceae bacterium]|nr:NAD-dependent epimerase/dehydratase family protein [Oscillospiraceae bacterium]